MGPRVVIAGGGTGGHLFPAIAIADELKAMKPDSEILFVGTKGKIESRVVPAKGFKLATIWISGFRRSFALSNIVFPFKVIMAFLQSVKILKQFKPDVVIGTGGYVSGPVLRAAALLGIPTLIQEQNSYPGVTTRMLAKRVNEVHLAFASSKRHFERDENLFVTGNPTRGALVSVGRPQALKFFGFDPADGRKTVLVFGGSLGARSINEAVRKNLADFLDIGIRLIWQTGEQDVRAARSASKEFPSTDVWVDAFIDRMDCAYAAADLVVSRAGATTIAELTRLGKPAVLIPYPHAAANHQVENARALRESGAAVMIDDSQVDQRLVETVRTTLSDIRLAQMSQESRSLGRPEAARVIVEHLLRLAHV
jgi:UDP-N-acetylglucosamine--N-acetylmuramyl-(pentapeptide) pyrophosphoryl-undecaprenol N-acetylglucosamine transferase